MDLTKFKPTHTFYLEVDLDANEWMETESGLRFFIPEDQGDVYQSKPFFGKLISKPEKSTIPLGEKVYVMYQAYDSLIKHEGKAYYVVSDDMIIGWGEPDDIKPYKCVFVDVEEIKEERILTDVDEDDLMDAVMGTNIKTPTHKATVIASDNGNLNVDVSFDSGDKIEYVKSVDWEFFVNRKKRYFIRWCDRILKCNGEMVNRYIEVKPKPKHVTKGGIVIPHKEQHYEAIAGKFAGKKVYIEEKRLELGKYVKTDYVYGHLT